MLSRSDLELLVTYFNCDTYIGCSRCPLKGTDCVTLAEGVAKRLGEALQEIPEDQTQVHIEDLI